MRSMNTNALFVPGEKLGTIEEGESGEGTYEDNGNIRAVTTGKGHLDAQNKVFKVTAMSGAISIPRVGEEVIARINSVQNALASLEIIRAGDRVLGRTFTGMLYHGRMGKTPVKTLKSYVKPGDIIRGKVISNKTPIQISTVDSRQGVILANCSKCGEKLEKTNKPNLLVCQNCGWRETRLLAPDYGQPKW